MLPVTGTTLEARLLGLKPEEQDDAAVNDEIHEWKNIVAGNFESNLGEDGLDC